MLDALQVYAPNVAHAHKLKRRRQRAMTERAKSGMPELRERAAKTTDSHDGAASQSTGAGFIDLPVFDPDGER